MEPVETLRQVLAQAREASARGDAQSTIGLATTAVDLAQAVGDERGHAEAQSLLLLQLFATGRFADALRHGHLALQGWQRLQAHDRVCETQLRLALSLSEVGIHARALSMARAAFDLAQQHDLRSHTHQAIGMLGGMFARAGHVDQGEMLLLQALSRASDARDSATATSVINTLLALLLGAFEDARRAADAARLQSLPQRIRRHLGPALARGSDEPHRFRRVVLRGNTGAALAACGQPEEGLVLLRNAATEASDAGFAVAEMRQRARLARLRLDQGDASGASAELDRLQALVDAEPHDAARIELLELRARCLSATGQGQDAKTLQDEARARRDAQIAQQRRLRERVEREAIAVLDALAPRA